MHNLFRNVALIQRTSAVTGTTGTLTFAGIDAAPYEGLAFVFCLTGNATTGASFKLQGDASTSGFGSVGDLTGTSIAMTTTIADGTVILDLYRPQQRWIRAQMVKTDTGDTVDAALVFGYRPINAAVTHSTASVIDVEYHVSPTTGTA